MVLEETEYPELGAPRRLAARGRPERRRRAGYLDSGGCQHPSDGLHAAPSVGIVQLGPRRHGAPRAFWKRDVKGLSPGAQQHSGVRRGKLPLLRFPSLASWRRRIGVLEAGTRILKPGCRADVGTYLSSRGGLRLEGPGWPRGRRPGRGRCGEPAGGRSAGRAGVWPR